MVPRQCKEQDSTHTQARHRTMEKKQLILRGRYSFQVNKAYKKSCNIEKNKYGLELAGISRVNGREDKEVLEK